MSGVCFLHLVPFWWLLVQSCLHLLGASTFWLPNALGTLKRTSHVRLSSVALTQKLTRTSWNNINMLMCLVPCLVGLTCVFFLPVFTVVRAICSPTSVFSIETSLFDSESCASLLCSVRSSLTVQRWKSRLYCRIVHCISFHTRKCRGSSLAIQWQNVCDEVF